jgi:methionyl aminopeptidase
MRTSGKVSATNGLYTLKGEDWLVKQRIAGKIVANSLRQLQEYCEKKTFHSMATLNDVIERYITSQGASCTFKNYKGFPSGVCISINHELVHGIPDDTVLVDGDVVSFDLGATYQGAIADSAITCIFGPPKESRHLALIKATEEALMQGIRAIEVGKRLGCIGHAISKYAKNKGYGCINQYGGHGLDWNQPHAAPFVANIDDKNNGFHIQPGLAIAIEPMLTTGSTKTWVDPDGWTVWCEAEMSAHFEHSIYVHEDHVEIITDRTGL